MTGVVAALAARVSYLVSVANSLSASKSGSGAQTAQIVFKRDGTILNHLGTLIGNWITPRHSTIGDNYYVRGTLTGGDPLNVGSPADATWVALTSDRTFGVTDPVIGTAVQWVGTFSVGRDGSTALSTGTGCSITADRTS